MFTFARRFRSTLAFAALASALVLADGSHEHRALNHGHRHLAANLTERDGHIEKRFDNTRFTYFPVGENACGSFDHDNDFVSEECAKYKCQDDRIFTSCALHFRLSL